MIASFHQGRMAILNYASELGDVGKKTTEMERACTVSFTCVSQTIQHKLAEIKTDVCVGRAFLDQCLDIHNTKGLDSQMASMAKYWSGSEADSLLIELATMGNCGLTYKSCH